MSYIVKLIKNYVTTNENDPNIGDYIGRFDHECVYEYYDKIDEGVIYENDDLDTTFDFCNDYMFGNFVKLYTYDNTVCERDMLYIYECDESGNIINDCIDDYYQDIVVRNIELKYN